MSSLLTATKSRSISDKPIGVVLASLGAGVDSKTIEKRLADLRRIQTGPASQIANERDVTPVGQNIGEQLRFKTASFKRLTAAVAMYLHPEWRARLFARLDALLNVEDWDSTQQLPSEQSFSTFLRMIIYLHPTRRPGIGITPNGHFAAAWTRGADRMVIECVGNDEVRWVLSREHDGEFESGAGRVSIHRIPDVTAGYDPEPLLSDGQNVLA
jgi:hypothetical protein